MRRGGDAGTGVRPRLLTKVADKKWAGPARRVGPARMKCDSGRGVFHLFPSNVVPVVLKLFKHDIDGRQLLIAFNSGVPQ
jgi:hypothetical protein